MCSFTHNNAFVSVVPFIAPRLQTLFGCFGYPYFQILSPSQHKLIVTCFIYLSHGSSSTQLNVFSGIFLCRSTRSNRKGALCSSTLLPIQQGRCYGESLWPSSMHKYPHLSQLTLFSKLSHLFVPPYMQLQ